MDIDSITLGAGVLLTTGSLIMISQQIGARSSGDMNELRSTLSRGFHNINFHVTAWSSDHVHDEPSSISMMRPYGSRADTMIWCV
jgi:hypothetical protein